MTLVRQGIPLFVCGISLPLLKRPSGVPHTLLVIGKTGASSASEEEFHCDADAVLAGDHAVQTGASS